MFGYILLAIGIIGTGIAAYHDIRTTDVPDYPALYMTIIAILIHSIQTTITGNTTFVAQSLLYGTILTAIGALQYVLRLWGGADMLLLGAFGFTFPYLPQEFSTLAEIPPWPFPVTLFFNLLIVGSLYSLLYATALFFTIPNHLYVFLQNIRSHARSFAIGTGVYILAFIAVLLIVPFTLLTLAPIALQIYGYFVAIYILYIFLSTIQKNSMERTISPGQLQEGDVLAEDVVLSDTTIHASRIEGLTNAQVAAIQKKEESVTVMHGVPYIPAFFFALIISVTIGDIIYLLLPL